MQCFQRELAYIVTAVSYTHNFLWNWHQVVGCLEEGVQGHTQEQEGDQECGGQIEMSSFEPVENMVSICDIDFFNFRDRQVWKFKISKLSAQNWNSAVILWNH
jgi:hypothetical protein